VTGPRAVHFVYRLAGPGWLCFHQIVSEPAEASNVKLFSVPSSVIQGGVETSGMGFEEYARAQGCSPRDLLTPFPLNDKI